MKTYTSRELSSPENAALLREIVIVLAHSFHEDAAHKWLLGPRLRKRYMTALIHYMRFIVRFALACDAITSIVTKDESPNSSKLVQTKGIANESRVVVPASSTVRAVSMTIPPHGNAAFNSILVSLRAGAYVLPLHCGFGIVWRLLTTWLPMLDDMHQKIFPDPATKYHNWYLFYIGVHPDFQGQGIGKELLLEIQDQVRRYNKVETEQANARGEIFTPAPLYLEASSFGSKRLYNRLGFEDICTGVYGTQAKGEDLKVADDAAVIGGRLYGMLWQAS